MIDEQLTRLRAHRNNIYRYRGLLKTRLTNLERQYLERRLSEELTAIEMISASALPPSLGTSAVLRQWSPDAA
jgi:hypothetical protein